MLKGGMLIKKNMYFRFANVLDFGDVYRFSQNLILKECSGDKNLQKIGTRFH